jgi:hypothetical protein
VSPEDTVHYYAMFRLSIDVCSHLSGRALFEGDFPMVDIVFNKKYFILICLVCFELLALPFVLSSIALILSW